jgi:hypothetical protein
MAFLQGYLEYENATLVNAMLVKEYRRDIERCLVAAARNRASVSVSSAVC